MRKKEEEEDNLNVGEVSGKIWYIDDERLCIKGLRPPSVLLL